MNVLVTGGAGYIGSVVVEELLKRGAKVVTYDNLSKGHRAAVLPQAEWVMGELANHDLLIKSFKDHRIEAVIHMAASSLVGESVTDPRKYYHNNVTNGLILLDAMLECGIKKIVFSSTAATYGEPRSIPIVETDPKEPTNPYGESKLAFEKAMHWYDGAYDLRYASLRYFNAAGASELLGEDHDPETHLIPLVLDSALGVRPPLRIFGDDYPTSDGTCIRDYIHVTDLAIAHILALDALDRGSRIYNLGSGGGYSVKEVIDHARQITGTDIPYEVGPRRAGDPAVLVASSDLIKSDLGWRPKHSDLRAIIDSAWQWRKKYPKGYEK